MPDNIDWQKHWLAFNNFKFIGPNLSDETRKPIGENQHSEIATFTWTEPTLPIRINCAHGKEKFVYVGDDYESLREAVECDFDAGRFGWSVKLSLLWQIVWHKMA